MVGDFDLRSHAIGMMLKGIGVEPSLSGLIRAANGNPEEVFQAVNLTVEMAPKVINAVMTMDARLQRIEALLHFICKEGGHDPHAMIAMHEAQKVAQAALDEASGRS